MPWNISSETVWSGLAQILADLRPRSEFIPGEAREMFRIMDSDYAESTLFPAVLGTLRSQAPGLILDIITPSDVSFLDVERGKVDKIGRKRQIRIFTRHYQAAIILAEQNDLIVTLPTRAALLKRDNPRLVRRDPPLHIPALVLTMAWSPLLQHSPGNRWLRRLIVNTARGIGCGSD